MELRKREQRQQGYFCTSKASKLRTWRSIWSFASESRESACLGSCRSASPYNASASLYLHTSAYVRIHQHTSAYVMPERLAIHRQRLVIPLPVLVVLASAYVSIRQHTSAYVSIRHAGAPQRKRLVIPLPVLVVLGKLGADVRSHLPLSCQYLHFRTSKANKLKDPQPPCAALSRDPPPSASVFVLLY
jgi:hypothetical protein